MSHSTDRSDVSHDNIETYMTDFILSITLTIIPFWVVMIGTASLTVVLGTILAMAVVRVPVCLACFLYMNIKSGEG